VITLVYPKEDENIYLIYDGIAFGPYDQLYNFNGNPIGFDGSLRKMVSSKGFFHDNNVEHHKFVGKFEYYPLVGGIVPFPSTSYPRKVKIPCIRYTGASLWYESNYGLAVPGGTSWRCGSSVMGARHYAFTRGLDNSWSYVMIITGPGPSYNVQYVYETKFTQITKGTGDAGTLKYYWESRKAGLNSSTSGINWNQSQSFATIMGEFNRALKTTGSNLSSSVLLYRTNPGAVLGPGEVTKRIDSFIANLFPDGCPILEKHYGDLAMEASQTVNANETNMLEFLRDLRHIKSMVPNLKNFTHLSGLRKAKKLASNYLGIKFGVMPTAHDLTVIWDAFKKHKPYLDRNGWPTYTAGYHVEETHGDFSWTLTQRIKLAIADEDSAIQSLIGKMDNIGVLPTFENLWDLIHYSFVVDWFVDVGNFLERVDSGLRIARLNIRYATMSRRTHVEGSNIEPSASFPFAGTVHWVHYHRWVSDQCPVPPLSLKFKTDPQTHWVEGGAMLLQRVK